MNRARADPPITVLALAVLASAVTAAGCASQGAPDLREGVAQWIAPYESREECLPLSDGDRLDYSFTSDTPLKFDIRYRDANATVLPVSRDDALNDSGIYRAVLARDYCATWEAGPAGAMLAFRLRRLAPPR